MKYRSSRTSPISLPQLFPAPLIFSILFLPHHVLQSAEASQFISRHSFTFSIHAYSLSFKRHISGNCEPHNSVTWKRIDFREDRLSPAVTRGTRSTSRTSLLPHPLLALCNRLHQIGPLLRYRPHLGRCQGGWRVRGLGEVSGRAAHLA